MVKYDVAIIGAGIIGISVAHHILQKSPDLKIALLEKEKNVAHHQTKRNSGVLHSGIYYKSDSLKAKFCIQGRKKLLEYCEKNSLSFKKIPKLILATKEDDLKHLQTLFDRGKQNGLQNIEILSKEAVHEIEPKAKALRAIRLSDCYVVDFFEIAVSLAEKLKRKNCDLFCEHKVLNIRKDNEGYVIVSKSKTLRAKKLINCAGLYADRIANLSHSYRIVPFRGEYYYLSKENHSFKHLIYPVPNPTLPFLGIHVTPKLNGDVELGPSAVLALSREGYNKCTMNGKDMWDIFAYSGFWKLAKTYKKVGILEVLRSFSKKLFFKEISTLVDGIQEKDLIVGKSGVRAQVLTKTGALVDDFCLIHEKDCIHVLNAPSPAATSSFAIGEHIAKLMEKL